MKLVIDTNIVISALIKDSKSREMITSGKLELVSPDFVLSEIRKYESHICTKSGLLNEEFEVLMALIFQKITIIPFQEYESHKEAAKKVMEQDIKDIPYVACYLALKCEGIWTNDEDYKDKAGVKVFSTEQLLKLVEGNSPAME